MLQAHELRVGNYLYGLIKNEDKGEITSRIIFQVVSGAHIDQICNKPDQSDYIEPIPLTPEILEKCGFEEGEGFVTPDGDVDVLTLGKFSALIPSFKSVVDISYNGNFLYHIKELHQLQNAYYILTNTEFSVNRRAITTKN